MRHRLWRPLASLLLVAAALPAGAAEPRVEFFSPQGTVKDVRQVAVRFSAAMVRIGDPRLADPFAIECPAPGRGRWADARNWVYDFSADLPGGIACRFTLETDLRSLAGEPLAGRHEFAFDTGGPAIRASLPREGATDIDEAQIFLLALDAPATPASVAEHARCAIGGHVDLVGVDVLQGEAREAVLALRRRLGYRYWRILWKDGRSTTAPIEDAELAAAEERITVLRCRQRIPPETEMSLVWGAGIAAAGGLATEREQRLSFKTRPAFTAGFSCRRVNAEAQCLPFGPLRIEFSAPVDAERARAARLRAADGTVYTPEPPEKARGTVESLAFQGPFPANTRFTVELPADLADDAGRPLANVDRFPLSVATDDYPPLARFSGEFGILERHTGGILPVTVRHLQAEIDARRVSIPAGGMNGRRLRITDDDAVVARWLRRIEAGMQRRGEWVESGGEHAWVEQTGDTSVFGPDDAAERFTIPRREPVQALEVIGIPLGEPGFYVVELASPVLGASLLGRGRTRHVATSALVTNLAVHLKWGRASSRVWVTTLDDAEPVADALVTVTGFCDGRRLWQGRTAAGGIARIDALPDPHTFAGCSDWHPQPILVSARAGDDFAFTVSAWQEGIEPSDFGLRTGSPHQTRIAHTVLDRSLFRAGETVSMKHYLRERTMSGLAIPGGLEGPAELTVRHRGSGQVYTFEVDFDDAGIAETRWPIPPDARLGDYELRIRLGEHALRSGSLRVEQFRVPTMTASIQPPAEPLVGARQAVLDLQVGYLSGGGAAGAPVKLRTLVEPLAARVAGYEDYSFAGRDLEEGLEQRPSGHDYFGAPEQSTAALTTPARVTPLTLGAGGALRATVPELPLVTSPHQLLAELEYSDASGELSSVAERIPLWPAALRVGLRTEGWAAVEDQLRFRVVVVDLHGRPVADWPVAVDLFTRQVYSYRKRLTGGFYAYESATETRRVGEVCAGRTDAQGLLLCEIAPGVSGSVILRAVVQDREQRRAQATRSVWVSGADDWWFGGGAGDRMDLLPEDPEYQAGETARFQVRMPFRSATALVTVEREGVMDAFVARLSGREPVIEIPIEPEYAPNVFVSVLAVRGRIGAWRSRLADAARRLDLPWRLEGGRPTALVDLSKPAYRLGVAAVDVGWQPHRLHVEVTPAADTYEVRQRASVHVAVRRADGGKLPAGAEIAFAAVDEGLLELSANRSWALLEAMMDRRGTEVHTATAQMQIVGKRHYGRKAVPQGGGGGREPARELLDTLLLWQGRVPLDAAGEADIEVPLNDALTRFRLVAVASAGGGLFGTGRAAIRTRQDLMLFAGLPPLVREGDRYSGTFTVRNAGERALAVQADATIRADGADPEALPSQRVELAPGEARPLSWEVLAPSDAAGLTWETTVEARDGAASDALTAKQRVVPAWPVRVQQATLSQVRAPLTVAARRPAQAVPGRGGIAVRLSSRLGGSLDALREYMAQYPYSCLEQRISQAVALDDPARWQAVMERLPGHLDDDGLLKYFASARLDGSDTLTAYLLAIADEAGWAIPRPQLATLQAGLRSFVEARISRDSPLPTADLTIRKLAALEALSRYGRATAEDLSSIAIEPNLWPSSALIDWLQILERVDGIADRESRFAEAQRLLRSRLNFQGTTMGFSTERDDALWWLMISGDVNAVRALLALLDVPAWRDDLPRMARGALGRQLRGRWNTTTANAWGRLAMDKFAAAFEAEPVAGRTTVGFAGAEQALSWRPGEAEQETAFDWPAAGAGDLRVRHAGTGQPWLQVQTRAALPLQAPLSSGYRIRRTLSAVERRSADHWTVGDIVRVSLEITAQSDMTWVVVDDPIPAGATILGGGLGRDSQLSTRGERRAGRAWPAYEERRFDAFRAYYRLVPKGELRIEYTLRLNNAGRFVLPATRVEALYAPEMFGELPNEPIEVQPAS